MALDNSDAFYLPDGEVFLSTVLTRGPWDRGAQHGGPPAALLGRAIERLPGGEGMMVARIALDILKPVPIAPVRVEASLVRPGKQVQLAAASLSVDGAEIMRASAWRIRVEAGAAEQPAPAEPAPAGPETGHWEPFFEGAADVGYHTAMEGAFVSGSFRGLGPATAWLRMRVPLVAGESPSPLSRVLIAADSGNGISAALDARRYVFVNTELTVHLSRLPDGEWVALDAVTHIEPHGVGLTRTRIFDRTSAIGVGSQALYVARRR